MGLLGPRPDGHLAHRRPVRQGQDRRLLVDNLLRLGPGGVGVHRHLPNHQGRQGPRGRLRLQRLAGPSQT